MTRMYLHATGSTCYDRSGITHPVRIGMDLEAILKSLCGVSKTSWESQYGWVNQPVVLSFDTTEGSRRNLDKLDYFLMMLGLLVAAHWGYDQHSNKVPDDLVVAPVVRDAVDESIVACADWYTSDDGWILVSAAKIDDLVESADDPEDHGITGPFERVADCLKRWSPVDRFYHA